MASSVTNEDGIPKELKEKLATFDTQLSELESGLKPLLSVSRVDLSNLEPIDEAKTDLVAAYAINSLFWMYLNVCGVNPKEHAVKQELSRIQSYMARVKEIEDKKKAPKLNKAVTKRYIRSALWKAAQQNTGEDAVSEQEPPTSQSSGKKDKYGSKRKRDDA
jgi:exosome complex protein LRP1